MEMLKRTLDTSYLARKGRPRGRLVHKLRHLRRMFPPKDAG
jgi:hypothetical protein